MSTRCTATAKGTREQCKSWAIKGATKCRLHGGLTPRADGTVGKRYEPYIPDHLLDRYVQASTDPEILNLNAEIGLIESRTNELLENIKNGKGIVAWADARDAVRTLRQELAGSVGTLSIVLLQLESAIDAGEQDERAWSQMVNLIEARRKLVESERKRLVDLKNSMTAEEALLFAQSVLNAVTMNVKDDDTRRRIAGEIDRLVSGGGTRRPATVDAD